MFRISREVAAAALPVALAVLVAGTAMAQSKSGTKIVCWKDKSGRVVGCGDRVPPEYEDSATKELDRRGVTRKTTESADVQARRKAEEDAQARQKEEEKKRLAAQKRQDAALLNTYANEKEIDQRRDRELLVVDRQLDQLRVLHRGASTRHAGASKRLGTATDRTADALKDEVAAAQVETQKLERAIAAREKEKEAIRVRYAQTRKRYLELSAGATQSTAAPARK